MPGARPALSLKARALKYLSAREHSRLELARKLAPHAESAEQVDAVLDDMERRGWLSAERFVESVVHRKSAKLGAARIRGELAAHQLPAQAVREAVSKLLDTEFERALNLWRRRYAAPPETPQERAKQMRFLAGRGFSTEVIRQVLKAAADTVWRPAEDDGDPAS